MAMNEFQERSKNEGRILLSYLKSRIKIILLYLFIIAVFFAVAVLYEYGNACRNMLYAVVITIFFGILFAAIDYGKYRKRSFELIFSLEKGEERTHFLPEAKGIQDHLYQQMLLLEEQEKRKLRMEYDEKKKDMTDYYSMWTHQIKTPIAALRLLLQDPEESGDLAGSEDWGKRKQEELEELFKIEQYAEMALYYARLESISSDLLFKFCDIRKVVMRTLRKYSVLFFHSGLALRLEEFELHAVTDEKWLSFVIEQILSNALKYTSEGEIAVYGSDQEGNQIQGKVVYLTVADTGIGISESDLPRIFERGFTGYNGRVERKSTGIGLYLCHQVMQGLSHSIQVKSAPGKGTKVILGFEQENY